MKNKKQMLSMLMATLNELQSRRGDSGMTPLQYTALSSKLRTLVDVLDDDIPDEYYEQIDDVLY